MRKVAGVGYRPTVQVPAEAKDRLAEWIRLNDNAEQGVIVGKIIHFFVDAPEPLQAVMRRNVPAGMAKAYAQQLRELADRVERDEQIVSVPQDAYEGLVHRAGEAGLRAYLTHLGRTATVTRKGISPQTGGPGSGESADRASRDRG